MTGGYIHATNAANVITSHSRKWNNVTVISVIIIFGSIMISSPTLTLIGRVCLGQ